MKKKIATVFKYKLSVKKKSDFHALFREGGNTNFISGDIWHF